MGFGLLYENDKGEYVLFTLARIACLLHICVKTSRFHYSIWATHKFGSAVRRKIIILRAVVQS